MSADNIATAETALPSPDEQIQKLVGPTPAPLLRAMDSLSVCDQDAEGRRWTWQELRQVTERVINAYLSALPKTEPLRFVVKVGGEAIARFRTVGDARAYANIISRGMYGHVENPPNVDVWFDDHGEKPNATHNAG